MIVKLSLGLSWFPLPPDNVLPGQGVTSLATCHMTALIRGLKARGRPGRAGANPTVRLKGALREALPLLLTVSPTLPVGCC